MQKADSAGAEKDYPPFALLEAIYMSWFTFEFLVSFFEAHWVKAKFLVHLSKITFSLIFIKFYSFNNLLGIQCKY